MDRLGDLNLINASPVCSQGHVPFCQNIRLRFRLALCDSLFDPDIARGTRGKVATFPRERGERALKGGRASRDKVKT